MKNKLLLVMEAALPRMKQYLADNEALIEAGRLAGVPFWGKPPGFEREFLAVFMHINIRSRARARSHLIFNVKSLSLTATCTTSREICYSGCSFARRLQRLRTTFLQRVAFDDAPFFGVRPTLPE